MSESNEELRRRLQAAKFEMMDRMVEAGWAKQNARSGSIGLIASTHEGADLLHELMRFAKLGSEMENAHRIAFWQLIEEMEEVG